MPSTGALGRGPPAPRAVRLRLRERPQRRGVGARHPRGTDPPPTRPRIRTQEHRRKPLLARRVQRRSAGLGHPDRDGRVEVRPHPGRCHRRPAQRRRVRRPHPAHPQRPRGSGPHMGVLHLVAGPRIPPPGRNHHTLRPVRGLLRGDRRRARGDRGVLPVPVIRNPPQRPRGCCEPTADVQGQLTTVRSTLIGPDGRPLAGREIIAVLRAAPSWLGDRTGRVVDTARTRTDRDGHWYLKLLPNKYLEPPTNEAGEPTPTSYYEISENGLISTALVPGAGEHVDCPDEQEPCTVWLRDILINGPQPGPVPWAPIDTLGKLHNVTPDADDPKRGQVLVFNGQVWEPKTTQAGSGPTRLDELEDVDARNPTQGQTLTYQDQEWVAGTPTTNLKALEDVEAPNPEQDQVLVFNGRVWTPGRAVTDLASLEDVDATNLTSGYALIFNGRVWEPGPVATRLDGLADVDTTTPPTSGQVLT